MRIANYMVAASAAALLLAGSAFAQSPGMDKGGAGAAQKSELAAPSAGGAMSKGANEPAAKPSGGAAPSGMKEGEHAQDMGKGAPANNAAQNMRPDEKKAPTNNAANEKNEKTNSNTASDTKSGADMNRNAAETKSGTSTKSTAQTDNRPSKTTGSTADSVSLSTQQKTVIRQKVLVSGAPRVDHVDFSINVGTRVPTSVHVVEVPETIIDIHPAWRGFRYFVVNDQIIIIDPHSMEIVAVLDV